MLKSFFTIFFSFIFLIFSAKASLASILVVGSSGEIIWNVLSDESSIEVPKHSSIEITQIAEEKTYGVSKVSLEKSDSGKLSLIVTSGNERKELDVSGVDQEIVEIEERPTARKLSVGVRGSDFTLLQKGVVASTAFPISVDPETAEIIIKTPSGNKFVSILPVEATEAILRTKLLSNISLKDLKIVEEGQELQYLIGGEKVFNFFNVYYYSIPVEANLSVATGEILSIKAPFWYKIVGFLMT